MLNFGRPDRAGSEDKKEAMSMDMLGEGYEEESGEEEPDEDEEGLLDFFTSEEAIKKLEKEGFTLTPPEGYNADTDEDEDDMGIDEPSDIIGSI